MCFSVCLSRKKITTNLKSTRTAKIWGSVCVRRLTTHDMNRLSVHWLILIITLFIYLSCFVVVVAVSTDKPTEYFSSLAQIQTHTISKATFIHNSVCNAKQSMCCYYCWLLSIRCRLFCHINTVDVVFCATVWNHDWVIFQNDCCHLLLFFHSPFSNLFRSSCHFINFFRFDLLRNFYVCVRPHFVSFIAVKRTKPIL